MSDLVLWAGFNAFVLFMLALDLGVFHRKAHVVSVKEATVWSAVWVSLALLFNLGIYHFWDVLAPGSAYDNKGAALAFLTGYLIEKSLSVDNIFVFVLIFGAFAVPARYQHRVLFWGILGALVMRAAMILAGVQLIQQFHWVIYLFGAFLVFTGVKMFRTRHDAAPDLAAHPVVRWAKRLYPVSDRYDGQRFFTRENGKRMMTPLFLVLLLVEVTDLVFAVDSIPAIFSITQDPFLVYTSNVFAILGLRSMYFMLAGIVDRFVYLKPALAFVLVFVGAKMLLVDVYKVPTALSLGVIGLSIGLGVGLSLWKTRNDPRPALAEPAPAATGDAPAAPAA